MDILVFVGFGIALVGAIGFLIAAFKESVLWGLGCLFISPLSLIFLLLHWSEAKNPFFLQLAGLGIIAFAIYMGADMPST